MDFDFDIDFETSEIFVFPDGPVDAPVVMLSHALGTTHELWDPQMPALNERFRVLRFDTRGHGGSAATEGPYSIESLGRDVLTVMDEQGVARTTYCGISMGGMIGLWLAINAPERIERLVVANATARIASPAMWDQRITTVLEEGMSVITQPVLDRWFTAGFQQRSPEAVTPVRHALLGCSPGGYAACCAAIRDMSLFEQLPTITVPTLVIVGSHDLATPPEEGRLIAEQIPGARLIELDAAHISNIEQADAFNTALLGFLEG